MQPDEGEKTGWGLKAGSAANGIANLLSMLVFLGAIVFAVIHSMVSGHP